MQHLFKLILKSLTWLQTLTSWLFHSCYCSLLKL